MTKKKILQYVTFKKKILKIINSLIEILKRKLIIKLKIYRLLKIRKLIFNYYKKSSRPKLNNNKNNFK